MNSKRQLITAAAIASGLGAPGAFALPAATVNDPAATVVYFGGATATDETLENLFLLAAGGLCTSASLNDDVAATRIDIYRNTNQRAIVCTATAGVLPAGKTKIVFLKESTGGSGNGTTPVALDQALQFINLGSGAFTCASDTFVNASGAFRGYHNHTGCTPLHGATTTPPVAGGIVPEAGISDVEPALFGLTPAQAALVETVGVQQIVFAPSVSLNLYRALQEVQGLPLDDTPAAMPSLTEAQVRGLYNGTIADWSQLTDQAGIPLTNGAAAGTPPTVSAVKLCPRSNSSGTQASFRTHYSRQGINNSVVPGVNTFVVAASTGAWTNDTGLIGINIRGNSSSGDVKRCLDAHHDAGNWAVGVSSTEGKYDLDDGINNNVGAYPPAGDPDTRPNEWRWIAVDGQRPTLEQAANGNWDFVTENVINKNNTIAADDETLVDRIAAGLGSKDLLNGNTGVNNEHQNAHGDGGVMALPFTPGNVPNGAPVTQQEMRDNPVSSQRRTTNFISPDNRVDTVIIVDSVAGGMP